MPRSVFARALDMLGLGILDEDNLDSHEPLDDDDGLYRIREEPRQSTATAVCPLVRAEPRDLEEAQHVADEIKRELPVILNLEECNPDEARRIRDFLSGVTYGVNGHMRKLASWVYACSPFDMPIEKLILDGSGLGQERYEREDELTEQY